MSSRHLAQQAFASLWSIPGLAGAPSSLFRLLSHTSSLRMPDVVVPPMGESIKEGTIAAVLKQVRVGRCRLHSRLRFELASGVWRWR